MTAQHGRGGHDLAGIAGVGLALPTRRMTGSGHHGRYASGPKNLYQNGGYLSLDSATFWLLHDLRGRGRGGY